MKDLNNKLDNGGATADGKLSSSEWNEVASELQSIIESTGQVLASSDLLQIVKAISTYSTTGDFYTGAGIVNAYTATAVSPMLAPDSLADGMRIRTIIPITNTGNSTLNAFGTGAVDIKHPGATNIGSDSLVLGTEYEFIYRTSPSTFWEVEFEEVIPEVVLPPGTKLLFAQASPPTGWTQDTTDTANNRMLRVVNTSGGGVAGSDSPILNDKIPTHNHTASSIGAGEHEHHLGTAQSNVLTAIYGTTTLSE
ncbi:MAG: hypothetical protein DRQ35_01200, partial [Gammaproteobacteria bacterium]